MLVKVGGDVWQAWEQYHRDVGWPWFRNVERLEWAYLPEGGPEGLEEFKAALRDWVNMMAIDKSQIENAIARTPTAVQASAIDKVIGERRRIARMRSAAANRVSDDSPWLVLQVVSGRELSVRDALEKENIEVLVPIKLGPAVKRQHRVIPPKSSRL
ncbi:hypothetical protein HGG76_10455 [Ochrobactrum tritici]|uniref:Uncharacterized protein n=1 Tax=Brucella tritici TaxID=94626 RepID=A0A7X6JAE4_9HYPH|nr:hypothetical protein [Brucella tritici]